MAYTRIEAGELAAGRPMPWDVYGARHTRLLRKGAVIRHQAQLDALVAHGLYRLATPGEDRQPAGKQPTDIAVMQPFALINRARALLAGAIRQHAPTEGPPFAGSIYRICHLLRMACLADKDAAIASILLKPWPSYAIKHMVDAAIIVEVVMHGMSIGADERRSVMAAALTMNLGMLNLQDSIHQQLGSPSPQQLKQIRLHPVMSHNLLIDAGVSDRIWLEAVLRHHELLNGSGYPAALSGEALPRGGRMVCIADVFSALVCPRGDRSNALPNAAMRDIFLMRNLFDADISAHLVKHIGIYPAGTLLQLPSGEMAVVMRQGKHVQQPLAAILTDARAQPLAAPAACEINVQAAKAVAAWGPDVAVPPETIWADTH